MQNSPKNLGQLGSLSQKAFFMAQNLVPSLLLVSGMAAGIALVSCGDKESSDPGKLSRDLEKPEIKGTQKTDDVNEGTPEPTPTATPFATIPPGEDSGRTESLKALELVKTHCSGCHSSSNKTPLTTFSEIRLYSADSAARINNVKNPMPPKYATTEQKNISPEAKEFLVNWLKSDAVVDPDSSTPVTPAPTVLPETPVPTVLPITPAPTAAPTPVATPTAAPTPPPVATPTAAPTPVATPTVAPTPSLITKDQALTLIQAHCAECHSPGGMYEDKPLTTLAEIKALKIESAARLIDAGNPMPPDYASDAQKNISAQEINDLAEWLKNSPDLK